MKTKIYIALLFLATCMGQVQASETSAMKDSIVISFGNKTRLIIYGESRDDLEKMKKYDLNALLADLQIKLDSARADTTYLLDQIDGRKYLKDKSDENYAWLNLRGIHIKQGGVTVDIGNDGEKEDEKGDTNENEYRRTGKNFTKARSGTSPRKGFVFALGLNTYGKNEPGVYNDQDYDLRPFASRYVSLGYIASARIVKGKKAGLHLDFGADFSWNNLMYDGNNTIAKTADGRVEFPLVKVDGKEVEMNKTKLVVPYVNLSLMPVLSFSKAFVSYVSAGVYGGYRLGSYTKTRQEGVKGKDHVRQNYFLNDYRYGVGAEIGFNRFLKAFVNYDLNTLHESNRGPKINLLSFGVKL